MEVTSQAPTAAPQAPSAMPTSVAQPSVAQYATSQAPTSLGYAPAPAAPAPQFQVPTSQPMAAPQASGTPAANSNPWQQAFQALSASLNTSSPSQYQASPSAYQTTPTPQQAQASNWGSMAPSVAPTSSPQASTQGYSEGQVNALVDQAIQHGASQAQDAYLSQVSDASLEVLQHFGAEAPSLLNTYACAVEDALIEQVQRGQSMSLMLEAAGEERAAMNLMLTDPDVLADYVNDFYGPNGPYPTPTESEAREIAQYQARQQFESEIEAQERNAVPQSFQRPEMDMPTPGRQVNVANDFWGGFSQMMDQNPEQAWQYLSQAPQGALSAKMLVQDL